MAPERRTDYRLSRGMLAGALSVLVANGCANPNADRVEPPPAEIPYLAVKLPPSARNYYEYESGLQHTMLQLRFEMDPKGLPLLEKRLPCRLGALATGPPEHGTVGTNDRAWYKPEDVKRHRGCEYSKELRTLSLLVDLDRADRAVVYAVISSE